MAKPLVRPLGKNGPQVTVLGFRTMGLSYLHGRLLPYESASMCTIDHLNFGETFWCSADDCKHSSDEIQASWTDLAL